MQNSRNEVYENFLKEYNRHKCLAEVAIMEDNIGHLRSAVSDAMTVLGDGLGGGIFDEYTYQKLKKELANSVLFFLTNY